MHDSFVAVIKWKSVASYGDRLDQAKGSASRLDDSKIKAANFNSGALNTLSSTVMNEEFKKISSTETAKETWTTL